MWAQRLSPSAQTACLGLSVRGGPAYRVRGSSLHALPGAHAVGLCLLQVTLHLLAQVRLVRLRTSGVRRKCGESEQRRAQSVKGGANRGEESRLGGTLMSSFQGVTALSSHTQMFSATCTV